MDACSSQIGKARQAGRQAGGSHTHTNTPRRAHTHTPRPSNQQLIEWLSSSGAPRRRRREQSEGSACVRVCKGEAGESGVGGRRERELFKQPPPPDLPKADIEAKSRRRGRGWPAQEEARLAGASAAAPVPPAPRRQSFPRYAALDPTWKTQIPVSNTWETFSPAAECACAPLPVPPPTPPLARPAAEGLSGGLLPDSQSSSPAGFLPPPQPAPHPQERLQGG